MSVCKQCEQLVDQNHFGNVVALAKGASWLHMIAVVEAWANSNIYSAAAV